MKLTFIRADHEVTGSCTLLEIGGHYGLIDCGMQQGRDQFENIDIPVPAAQIEFVLVTHAHMDHTGHLPLLYKQGFRGTVYATEATCDLCGIMLRDAAHIQMSEAEWKGRKAARAGQPAPEPLYTLEDVEGVLRLLRIDPNAQTEEITEEDIRMRADIAEEKGAITEAEGEMIDNVFEFNNHTAFDVMTHRTDVVALPVDATDDEILRVIRESGLSRIPVYEKTIDDVVGILRTREYLLYRAMDEYKPLRTILHTPNFVPETVRTDVLFRSMQQKKNHIAIVVDEYGGVSGLVSMEDLLEEIVGNIYDEYDPQVEQAVTKVGDNLWRVSGICELSVLSEALDIALPLDEDYDTLSGLVFSQLSSIPQDGSHPELDVAGLHIYVEEISDHRVEWAQVSKIYPEEEDESDAGAEKSAS